MRLPDSGYYRGHFAGGRMHGRGVLEWRDGARYEGGFRDGLMHGQGIHVSRSGERYEGGFRDGMMDGQGRYHDRDGAHYEGGFADGRFHGRGVYTGTNGERYEGEFARGALTGRGRHHDRDGLRYEGEFRDWAYHGRGVYRFANGDRYEGGFAEGTFHGRGVIVPAAGAAGEPALAGRWERGEFVAAEGDVAVAPDFEPPPAPVQGAESLLYEQPGRVAAALAAVQPSRPGHIDLYFAGFAGDGETDVFMREVRYAAATVAERYDASGRALLLVNNRATLAELPLATGTNLEHALAGLAQRMDPEEDVLFLLLSSHGTDTHELSVQLGDLPVEDLPAQRLGAIVAASGIRWKIIVLSACYSGGFIDALLDPGTLVITAARHDHVSFGCSDEHELTYFGRAFFERGLPGAPTLTAAFDRARTAVRDMEAGGGHEFSDPQMAWGDRILGHLAAWEQQESAP